MEDINLRTVLIKIGISSNIKGFYYILAAVEIIKKQKIHTNMSSIYTIIARDNNSTLGAVERGIRHSIQQAHKNSSLLKGLYENIPDNSALIYDLAFNFDVFKMIIKSE